MSTKTTRQTLDAFLMGSEWFHAFLNDGIAVGDDTALKEAFDRKAEEEGIAPDLRGHAYCGLIDERGAYFGWD